MATFAKSSFNVSVYASSRPTYPTQLFGHIFEYHRRGGSLTNPRLDHAVDLGCGTGQATSELRGRFKHVTCVDPSASMLEKAKEYLLNEPVDGDLQPGTTRTTFSFEKGSAEDLGQIIPDRGSGSVDLLIAAQACHWFDWSKVWPETSRVLRKGGTAAFWVYGEFRLAAFPGLTTLITDYGQGTDRNSSTSVGSYFQRPGRTILERSLVDVPAPEVILGERNDGLKDFQRVYFNGSDPIPDPHVTGEKVSKIHPEAKAIHPVIMRTSWTWLDLLGYLRTWSALHSYHERFPDDLKRQDDIRFLSDDIKTARSMSIDEGSVRGGDISIRFWKNMREAVHKELSTFNNAGLNNGKNDKGVGLLDTITVEWPISLLLVRKSM